MKIKTLKGWLKTNIIGLSLCIATEIAFGASAVAVTNIDTNKVNKIIDNTDYRTFNEQYKIEKIEEFLDQYKDSGFDENKFKFDVQQIKDYDKDKYMTEQTTPEIAAEYKEAKRIKDRNWKITMGGTAISSITGVVLAIGTTQILKRLPSKKEENVEETEASN